jgi:hypothetical protein
MITEGSPMTWETSWNCHFITSTDFFYAGVFDENDNRTFEEEEFVEMLLALFRGMAAMLLGHA